MPVRGGRSGERSEHPLRGASGGAKLRQRSRKRQTNGRQSAWSPFALRVPNGTRPDPEQPTAWRAELVCGKADPDRRARFERYTIAVLKSVFFGNAPAQSTLLAATNDVAATAVSTRALPDFKP
jgi:hypothetical protein